MNDPNYWLGRLIATLKQVVRETGNEGAVRELRSWSGSELCSNDEAEDITIFLDDVDAQRERDAA